MDCLLPVFWESEVLYDGQADCDEDEAEVPATLLSTFDTITVLLLFH